MTREETLAAVLAYFKERDGKGEDPDNQCAIEFEFGAYRLFIEGICVFEFDPEATFLEDMLMAAARILLILPPIAAEIQWDEDTHFCEYSGYTILGSDDGMFTILYNEDGSFEANYLYTMPGGEFANCLWSGTYESVEGAKYRCQLQKQAEIQKLWRK